MVVKIPTDNTSTTGYIIAVPATNFDSDSNPQLCTIQLQDGTTTTIPGSILPQFIKKTNNTVQITLPKWKQIDKQVRYTIGNVTHQGHLHHDSHNQWFFTSNKTA